MNLFYDMVSAQESLPLGVVVLQSKILLCYNLFVRWAYPPDHAVSGD